MRSDRDKRQPTRPGANAQPPHGGRGPRRPVTPQDGTNKRPGQADNRPDPRLVINSNKSTQEHYPLTAEIHVRHDDVGRMFAYLPRLVPLDQKPPEQGRPITTRLSARGTRHIKGAALKAGDLGLPLKAFWTFTFAPEARAQIADGSLRMSAEMKRIINVIRQKLRRGGVSGEVVFIWVAENPSDDNPHVHLLTNLLVRKSEFESFTRWVEERWGHGTVHLERIRNAKASGYYMLKAVGYTTKGDDESQGEVYGRRYGISRMIQPKEEKAIVDVTDEYAECLGIMQAILAQREPGEQYMKLGNGVTLTPYGLSFGPRHEPADLLDALDVLPQLVELHRPQIDWDEVPFV